MSVRKGKKLIVCSLDALHLKVKRGRSVVNGKPVGLVSSVGTASNLEAGGRGFVLHWAHFFLLSLL